MKVKNLYLKILEYLHWVSINDHPYSINSGYLLFFKTTIWGRLLTWQWSRRWTLTPSTKRVSHRGSLLKGVAVYRVLNQSILNAKFTGRKNLVGKGAQATGMTASLRILSSKADSNTWESFTRSGLKLESVHQESHAQTSSGKGLPSHFWTRDNVRSILPGLWRKRTELLLSGPKSSFQMKVNSAFYLEIKVPESGGRVERHRIHVAEVQCEVSTVSDDLGCHVIC